MDAVSVDCAQLRVNLGAYVLGALDTADRSQLEAHLGDCPGCRDELVSLAALPGLLSRVDPTTLDVPAGAGSGSAELLAQRAVQALRARRRARPPWVAGIAAAAVILGVLAGAGQLRDAVTGSGDQTVSASDAAGRVTASVRLQERASGTAMSLRLSGVGEEQRCALVAIAADGRREVAATWEASYGGSAAVDGQTSIARSEITALAVVTLDGRELVRVPV